MSGWFPDPTRRHEYRYHDGRQWTDQVSDRGVAGFDALSRSSPPLRSSFPPAGSAGTYPSPGPAGSAGPAHGAVAPAGTASAGRGLVGAKFWIIAVAAVVLVGGGILVIQNQSSKPEPSTQNFCKTYEEQVQWLVDEYDAKAESISDDPIDEMEALSSLFASLNMLSSLPGDLSRVYDRLEPVSPEEIHQDVVTLEEGFSRVGDRMGDAMGDAADDPLGALIDGLATGIYEGFQLEGPMTRVDEYAMDNCNLETV